MKQARKLALITGASSGIGFELARIFAKNDYDLIVTSGSDKILDKAKLLRLYEVEVTEIVADLATQEGVDSLWSKLGRPLDVAVLNAGVGAAGEFVKTSFKDDLNVLNLNIVYLVDLSKRILQDMVIRNSGKMLFTSSVAAEMPGPYYATYAASKAFVQSFVEAIRYEMKDTKKNISITSLQPGPTDTNFFARANMLNTPAAKGKKDDPALVAQQGFDALMSGKDHVVGGSFKNKVQSTAAKFMSEEQGAAAQGKSARPDSIDK